jgi:hypothetical protein
MITFTLNYIALIYAMLGIICGCVAISWATIAIKNRLEYWLARHRQANHASKKSWIRGK